MCSWGSSSSLRPCLLRFPSQYCHFSHVEQHDPTGVTLVGVAFECAGALGDLESALGDDLVEGVGTTTENLARVAVAVAALSASIPLQSRSPDYGGGASLTKECA